MMKNILLVSCVFFLSAMQLMAQDKLKLELKDAKPDIYIDGKKYDYAIFELLDQDKIESVNVIKDKELLKEYDSPNGVILIKTKKASQQTIIVDEEKIKIRGSDKDPLIVINGEESDKESLSKLSPDDIESINVLKGEHAIKEYDAPNGVIIVKTKN